MSILSPQSLPNSPFSGLWVPFLEFREVFFRFLGQVFETINWGYRSVVGELEKWFLAENIAEMNPLGVSVELREASGVIF